MTDKKLDDLADDELRRAAEVYSKDIRILALVDIKNPTDVKFARKLAYHSFQAGIKWRDENPPYNMFATCGVCGERLENIGNCEPKAPEGVE